MALALSACFTSPAVRVAVKRHFSLHLPHKEILLYCSRKATNQTYPLVNPGSPQKPNHKPKSLATAISYKCCLAVITLQNASLPKKKIWRRNLLLKVWKELSQQGMVCLRPEFCSSAEHKQPATLTGSHLQPSFNSSREFLGTRFY